ncbi:hypothetical protein C8R45DRAFT_564868 [Mycena sanguinolenta]|nr:hypothetical protein C8R45DRAFT_564868 [Mycena sanguinolenta]
MESLPQELVNAIVREIDDTPSLKACALAGLIFRDACQRVLLSSLTLKNENAGAAQAFLAESPHVATYITRLEIQFFKGRLTEAKLHAVQQHIQNVIGQLTNVHHCIMAGTLNGDSTPAFMSAVLDLLARQPLRELNVRHLSRIPLDIILRLLASAPAVTFFFVLTDSAPCPSVLDNSQCPLELEDLFVGPFTASEIPDLLVHLQSKSLRRLSFFNTADNDAQLELINTAACTLEHLYLGGCADSFIPPPLPSLRSFSFDHPCSVDIILAVVRVSPLLTDIMIFISSLIPGTLTTLDVALAAHPKHLIIRWRINVGHCHKDGQESKFVELATNIRAGMPKTFQQGRIVLEKCDKDAEVIRRLTGSPRRN